MLNSDLLAFVDALATGKMVDTHLTSAQIHEVMIQVAGAVTAVATISSPQFVRYLSNGTRMTDHAIVLSPSQITLHGLDEVPTFCRDAGESASLRHT